MQELEIEASIDNTNDKFIFESTNGKKFNLIITETSILKD